MLRRARYWISGPLERRVTSEGARRAQRDLMMISSDM